MPRIAPVNLTDLPPEAQAAVDEHLRQGYRLTNEKLTLLHNVSAFEALEAQSYAVDRELQRLVGKRAADFFEYAISVENDCIVCTTYFGKLLRNEHHIDPNAFRLTRREELLMQYARSLARDPKGITDKAFQELKEEFLQNGDGDGNPVDEEKAERIMVVLTAMGAMMIANNTVNDALQVDV